MSFFSLQQHCRKNPGLTVFDSFADLNENSENEENSDQLLDELNPCQHFLTDIELENGRHKVFNFKLSKINPNLVNENTIKYLRNLNVHQKSTLSWDLCSIK